MHKGRAKEITSTRIFSGILARYVLPLFLVGMVQAQAPTENWYAQANRSFCSDNLVEFQNALSSISSSDERFISSRILALLSKEGQLQAESRSEIYFHTPETLTEADRILGASFLLQSSYEDFDKIRNLLNFHSLNNQNEAFRLAFLSWLEDLEGNLPESLKLKIDAFYTSPQFDEALLMEIFAMAVRGKNADRVLQRYLDYIDKISDTSPIKYQILAYKEMAFPSQQKDAVIASNFKRAYDLCPFNQIHMVDFVFLLLSEGKAEQAEEILNEVVKRNRFYSPYVDFFLMKIHLNKSASEKARTYLNNAYAKRKYLERKYRYDIEEGYKKEQFWYWAKIVTIFLGLLLLIFFIFRKIKRPTSDS